MGRSVVAKAMRLAGLTAVPAPSCRLTSRPCWLDGLAPLCSDGVLFRTAVELAHSARHVGASGRCLGGAVGDEAVAVAQLAIELHSRGAACPRGAVIVMDQESVVAVDWPVRRVNHVTLDLRVDVPKRDLGAAWVDDYFASWIDWHKRWAPDGHRLAEAHDLATWPELKGTYNDQ